MIPDYLPESFCVFVPLFEYNHCHDPKSGTFAVKGQGRCLGVVAQRSARVELERGDRKFRTDLKKIARLRREVRVLQKKHLPAYMRPDAERAWRAERAVVNYLPGEAPANTGQARQTGRYVDVQRGSVARGYRGTKAEQLSVLRHELGHLDRTPLGSGGHRLFGKRLGHTYNEEVRAWKNAIRNSPNGRVDWRMVRKGLRSYMPTVAPAELTGGSLEQRVARTQDQIVDKHIALLKRYGRKVRRALKAERAAA